MTATSLCTSAALAVNTKSGSPSTGSRSSTSAPACWVMALYRFSHWRLARSSSQGGASSIQGLMAYSTVKYFGSHIRMVGLPLAENGVTPTGEVHLQFRLEEIEF